MLKLIRSKTVWIGGLLLIMLVMPALWPQIDLSVSNLFYRASDGFFLADNVLLTSLHSLAVEGSRVIGVAFAAMALVCLWRKSILSLDTKAWLFLLLALIIAPGLVANVGLKDHWGRARPREVVEFGGSEAFTPFYEPHFERAHPNGSFVAGDPAFGFFLPAFAYVAPRRQSRRVFWAGMAAGGVLGFDRLAMGGHFLSDVIYAAFFMLVMIAVVHAAMYGRKATMDRWREWLSCPASGDRSKSA